MEYLNRFRSTVSSVAAQVQQALPGNPVLREYEVERQVGAAGPSYCFKIYAAKKLSTKQPVSVWLFEKKQIERWPRSEREAFPDLIRRGVSQLTRLRHPRILTVERALEESRDSFAFCTEEVFASLGNLFGDTTNLDDVDRSSLSKLDLDEYETRHGLCQLAEALVFLHNDARLLHGNVAPSSVVVNSSGAWKLAGFDFCVAATPSENGVVGVGPSTNGDLTFDIRAPDRSMMAVMAPDAEYAAPEVLAGKQCDGRADVFALGMLACACFNFYKPVDRGDIYTRLKVDVNDLPAAWFRRVPSAFVGDLRACLVRDPSTRLDAVKLTRCAYFDDVGLKTLNYLETLAQMDNAQKMTFFKGLGQILPSFSKRPLLQKVLPHLATQFSNLELAPFILPSVFYIAQHIEREEFAHFVLPALRPLFNVERPYQIILVLLQNMSLLVEKATPADVKTHIMPLVYNAVGSENMRVQELCLTSIVPQVARYVDRESMKTQLLPKLLKTAVEGTVLSIRVQSLVCIGKLLEYLEAWMVADMLLPAMPKVNSREPSILMAILGVYRLINENVKFGIGREQCARSVLPFLMAASVESTLNVTQFDQFMNMIRALVDKVEREQRTRLGQLSAGQEGGTDDFVRLFNQPTPTAVGVLSTTTTAAATAPTATSTMDDFFASMGTASQTPVAAATRASAKATTSNTSADNKQPSNASADFDDFFDTLPLRPPARTAAVAASPLPAALPKPPSAANPITRSTTFKPTILSSSADPFSDLFSFTPQTRAPPNFGAPANNKPPTSSAATPKPPILENPLDFLS